MHISFGARTTGAFSKCFICEEALPPDTPAACKAGARDSSETSLHVSLIVRRIKTNSDLRGRIIIRIITGIIACPL